MTEDTHIDDFQEVSSKNGDVKSPKRRKRQARSFPGMSFSEALFLGQAIQQHGAGQPIRRLTLFESLNRSPDSGTSRALVTASNQYGITTGSYNAETLELTNLGKIATDPNASEAGKIDARVQLGIEQIHPFRYIYEKYVDSRLPSVEVLRDAAKEADVSEERSAECVETFLANARELGLLRTIGGSEHLVTKEAVIERASPSASPQDYSTAEATTPIIDASVPSQHRNLEIYERDGLQDELVTGELDNVCFIITPIGSQDSVERKHADLVMSSLIEPALAELGLVAVRADRISKPGLITGQIIHHVVRSKLVIADLSFNNPNVYYELALRHAIRRPVVQIIRTSDKLPFDVGQFRTVMIDMTDIYTLVPQLEIHRQEITRQARAAIDENNVAESPLSQFYPSFWDEL